MNQTFARHGLSSEVLYFVESSKRRDYAKATHAELVKDVNICFKFLKQLLDEKNELADRLAKVMRDKDELMERLNKATRRLDGLALKFWIVSGLVVAEGAIIGWCATELFSRLK